MVPDNSGTRGLGARTGRTKSMGGRPVDRLGQQSDGHLPGQRPPMYPVPAGWWFDLVLATAFGALTAALVWWPPLLRLDLAVRDWVDGHRPPPVHALMVGLDLLGQGGPLMTTTLAVGFWLAWRYRSARPILPACLAAILTTASILPLKQWTARGAPHFGSVRMFSHGSAVEYPSGHVTNAVVYWGTLALLLLPHLPAAPRRVLQWAPRFLVFLGTTYLAYHWLSDSVGGLLLGMLLVRISLRVPWHRVPLPARWERRQPPNPRLARRAFPAATAPGIDATTRDRQRYGLLPGRRAVPVRLLPGRGARRDGRL